MHRPVGLGGQAGEEVRQVGLGVDAFSMAVANQRVEHGWYASNAAPLSRWLTFGG